MNKEILEKIKKVVASNTQKAVRFSNDAVDNLKDRIMISGVKCSTFHKLGKDILNSSLENKKTIEIKW